MINSDICSCCGEIWNRQNIKSIPLGKHELHLCPDCYAEYIKPLNNIRAEIEHLTITEGGEDYIRKMAELYSLKIKVLQIIDEYKT